MNCDRCKKSIDMMAKKKLPIVVDYYSPFGAYGKNIKALYLSEQSFKYMNPEKIISGEVIYVPKDQFNNIKDYLNNKMLTLKPDEDVCIPSWYYVYNIQEDI